MTSSFLSVWPAGVDPSESNRPWPKISVVTPNFNEEATLEKTILSITAQRYPNLEYIVMDDGSTDRSVEIIRRHQRDLAHWETHENRGQYATINRGFSFATGEIFAWLNSDDIYLPWTLRAVAEIFAAFPDIDWIMGLPSTIQNGVVHRVRSCLPFPQELLLFGMFGGLPLGIVQQESCFWRRSLWEKAGGLNESWKRAADFELWTRFAKHAPLVCCDMLLGGFTRTGKNRSVVHSDAYGEEVKGVQKFLSEKLSPSQRTRRESLIRHVAIHARGQHNALWKYGTAGLFRLNRFQGPVLRQDFQTQQFVRTDEFRIMS